MPSFWEGLKRFATGKPVFDKSDVPVDGKQNDPWLDDAPVVNPDENPMPEPGQASPAPWQPKVLPRIVVDEIECDVHGNNMQLNLTLKNESPVQVEVDKIRILGKSPEIDYHLRPGEEREFPVYSGEMPKNTYNNQCEVQYKDKSGDYFFSRHQVEFKQEHDGYYSVLRIKFYGPIKDM